MGEIVRRAALDSETEGGFEAVVDVCLSQQKKQQIQMWHKGAQAGELPPCLGIVNTALNNGLKF